MEGHLNFSIFFSYCFMKMDKKKIVTIFGGLIFFLMLHPFVEAKEKKYNFGFTIGICRWPSGAFDYMRVEPKPSFRNFYQSMNILEQDIRLKTLYRLSFQYNFSSYFGLEVEFGHQRASYKVTFYLRPKYPELPGNYTKDRLSWSVSSIILNAVFQARKSEKKIVPYGFLGLGLCSIQGEEEEREEYGIEIHSSLDLALKAGGGVSCYLPKILPLGFNLRAFIMVLGTRVSGFYSPYGGFYSSYGGSDIVLEGYNIIWGIELGLKYRF